MTNNCPYCNASGKLEELQPTDEQSILNYWTNKLKAEAKKNNEDSAVTAARWLVKRDRELAHWWWKSMKS